MTAKTPPLVQLHPPRPRGRPKAEDVEELEARLISVARQTFIAHGYGATSMASIARAARVSKNTLYARFPAKSDLFRAIIDDQVNRADAAVWADARRSDKSLDVALRTFGEQTLRSSLGGEILNLNRLIFSEVGRFPELGDAANARWQVGVQKVATHMRQAAERDGLPCAAPEAAAEIFLLMLRGWYSQVALTDRPVSGPEIRDAVDRIVRIFMCSRETW